MKVAIFEEHEIFRRGLVSAVTEAHGLEVVFEGPLQAHPVDCDVAVTSPTAMRSVTRGTPVVVCADSKSRDTLAPGGDVFAVLSRSEMTPEQLVAAIHAAAQGFRLEAGDEMPLPELDDRRRAVLELLSEGARTREISEALGYSERTIKAIIQDLEHSLGARSRAQVVAVGIRRGLI